jgi:hypothetical protein
MPTTGNWYSCVYGNQFLALDFGTAIAATSSNGTSWTQRTLPSSANWLGIAYGNGIWTITNQNTNYTAVSPDGINWGIETLPIATSQNLRQLTFGNGRFVAPSVSTSISFVGY